MLEEFTNMIVSLFKPENLLTLMFIIDAFAVIGIFANAFTGRNSTPPKKRVIKKKPNPRKINANKLYYNQDEKVTVMEGENGLNHVKEAVGPKLKHNGTLEQYPTPLKTLPESVKGLVHKAKNNVETPKIESEKEKPSLKSTEIRVI